MALKSSSRNGRRVTKIVAHTAEGARTKESLYRYFDQPSVMASSHVGIDADGVADWVPRERAAWTLRDGNSYSVNAEICGFARWTRAQWLSTGTVDGCRNPRQMIRNLAAWIKREAKALGIPLHRLTVAEWRAGKWGYGDHDDYTDATGDGSHWDVGEGFPWDVLATDIRGSVPKENDMELTDAWDEKKLNELGPGKLGWALLNIKQNVAATRALVTSQGAAITALTKLVAANDNDLTEEQVRTAIREEMAKVVKVDLDIEVTGSDGNPVIT